MIACQIAYSIFNTPTKDYWDKVIKDKKELAKKSRVKEFTAPFKKHTRKFYTTKNESEYDSYKFLSSYPRKEDSKYTEISKIKELGYLDDVTTQEKTNKDFIKNNITPGSIVILDNDERVKILKIFGNYIEYKSDIIDYNIEPLDRRFDLKEQPEEEETKNRNKVNSSDNSNDL